MNFKSILLVLKLNEQENVTAIAAQARRIAMARGISVFIHEESCDENTLVVALGGDGTMLEAMRIAARHNATAVGVNLGHIGFLTDFEGYKNTSPDLKHAEQFFEQKFDDLLQHTPLFPVEERILVSSRSNDFDTVACNEVTISSDKSDTMINYRIYVDDYEAGTHRANSIIVATPTGSTAYALSAGGGLMMPAMKALQIVPVAPSTLTSRPIFVGQKTKIIIDAWGGKIAVRNDGSTQYTSDIVHTISNPYRVNVEASSRRVRILHDYGWNFFDVLSKKLGWIKNENQNLHLAG